MPKRTNPFGDSSPLQFKTHVGTKEIDMGVCQQQNMKQVYEKTKDLLFKGAQKQESVYNIDANSNHILEPQPLLMTTDLPAGQMCFDKDGQLTTASTVNQCRSIDSMCLSIENQSNQFQFGKQKPAQDPNACFSCRKPVIPQLKIRCHFCDKIVCSTCSRNCDDCTHTYCQMCSVLNYDEAMERAFCFNCSP
ncbi:hypothetical protein SNE40_010069 [Patella caerulea]|uniref:Apoptosis regulatory protein Siva n=1 Tax=Patella caerulea TaxID=87958 RepID=A0AAN8JTF7_PATCE